MFSIVFRHTDNGKLELVYYFENVTVTGNKISGKTERSRMIAGKIEHMNAMNSRDLAPYLDQSMRFQWYDKVFTTSSVIELIDLAAEEPRLLELIDLLYRRA